MSEAGIEAFAQRAAAELRTTGETARSRSAGIYDRLTPREMAIARLVTTGATSGEVAARLFLSPRTADPLSATSSASSASLPAVSSEPTPNSEPDTLALGRNRITAGGVFSSVRAPTKSASTDEKRGP